MIQPPTTFWNTPQDQLLQILETTTAGLKKAEAMKRLQIFGPNSLTPKKHWTWPQLLISQFKSPIILILLAASIVSFFLQDTTDSLLILIIVLASSLLGFWQECGAIKNVQELLSIIQTKASLLRESGLQELPIENIVPGDIIQLRAGDIIPADCRLLASNDLFVDEATLTGEAYPAEKSPGSLLITTPLAERTNSLFAGTHVISGSGTAVAVLTGKLTEFGKISKSLTQISKTEFEKGISKFSQLLMITTLFIVLFIFVVNAYLARPILESLLFATALAVGLTPQLLPAIISINLAHGARLMARKKAITKHLPAIENFGSMNVLCLDKTGTLTEGTPVVHSSLGPDGKNNQKVLFYSYINAFYETSFPNPVDKALRKHQKFDLSNLQKLDEIPYDFIRKRLSVLVSRNNQNLLITKGTVGSILGLCTFVEINGKVQKLGNWEVKIKKRFLKLSRQGSRVLGVGYKKVGAQNTISRKDEKGLTFLGFIVLSDPPKSDIKETIKRLQSLGISLKIITGDNSLVAKYLSQKIGIKTQQVLTGEDIDKLSDEALVSKTALVNIFSQVEPSHKERIVHALKKAGNVVGFLGDGINDAPALHAADVGISVNSGTDSAKEAASIVLLEKDLAVLCDGVIEGRRTFQNTLKYIFMAASANFGNMFSMAGASLLLPFLPLLPKQILLLNLMTDFPEMTIATDNVDPEILLAPRQWNIGFIKNFMLVFGTLSSLFDYLTFGVLHFLQSGVGLFRTAWFLESIVSAAIIVLVVRSRKPFFASKPSKYLLLTTILIVLVAILLVFSPGGTLFGLVQLPLRTSFYVGIIVILYVVCTEAVKKFFYARFGS